MEVLISALLYFIVLYTLGYAVAGEGRKVLGGILGLCLGPVGVLIAVFLL